MSFLNQLKAQASELQNRQRSQAESFEASTAQVEASCLMAWTYLADLARQLNVLQPTREGFTLDGKTPWPGMKLLNFRADFRKKKLRDRDVHDYLALGWDIVPQAGAAVTGSVSANFPPDLQRIESRIAAGHVRHERIEIRQPEKNTLLAIRFDYSVESRGSVQVSADHEAGKLAFRIANAEGFGVIHSSWNAAQVKTATLDEIAKMIVGQPHSFA